MKLTNKIAIAIFDENYHKLAPSMTRKEILAIDNETTTIVARGEEYHPFSRENKLGRLLDSFGIYEFIESRGLQRVRYLEERKTYVENQIEVLEGLLCDSIPKPKGAKVGKFSKEMRAEIKKRLHKMSPEKAESSLHDVKMGKITIFDWLKEPDVVSKRDEEYERALRAAGKEKAHA